MVRLRGLKENQGLKEPAEAGFVSVAATLVAKATQIWTFKTSSNGLPGSKGIYSGVLLSKTTERWMECFHPTFWTLSTHEKSPAGLAALCSTLQLLQKEILQNYAPGTVGALREL
jgi:hypothetical protein